MTKRKKEASRILVVEDEPGIVDLCRKVLEREGYEVDVALNGRDAQPIIERDDEYDLCLVDVRTPEMTGPELYQWMRETHPQLADRVIFTTGSSVDEGLRDLVEQSGRPLLPKPFTPEELRTAVWDALRR